MMSKKIMDIHNKTPRNQSSGMNINMPVVEEFSAPQASYNIPQDVLTEVSHTSSPKKMTQEIPTEQRIMSSKLPDEIKRLMIEHPIQQPNTMGGGSVISNELVEKAARLMNNDIANNVNPYQPKKQQVQENVKTQNLNTSLDKNVLKNLILNLS